MKHSKSEIQSKAYSVPELKFENQAPTSFAYNLIRELQMQTARPSRHTTAKRASLWVFEKVDTIRKTLIQRAGRLTRPQNSLTLTISANPWMEKRFKRILNSITGLAIA